MPWNMTYSHIEGILKYNFLHSNRQTILSWLEHHAAVCEGRGGELSSPPPCFIILESRGLKLHSSGGSISAGIVSIPLPHNLSFLFMERNIIDLIVKLVKTDIHLHIPHVVCIPMESDLFIFLKVGKIFFIF